MESSSKRQKLDHVVFGTNPDTWAQLCECRKALADALAERDALDKTLCDFCSVVMGHEQFYRDILDDLKYDELCLIPYIRYPRSHVLRTPLKLLAVDIEKYKRQRLLEEDEEKASGGDEEGETE